MVNRRLLVLTLILGLAAHGAAPAMADDGEKDDDGNDNNSSGHNVGNSPSGGERNGDETGDRSDPGSHVSGGDWIREQVKDGKVAPLGKILATVRRQYGGQVVRVRLTGQGSKRVYDIRVIDPGNQLIEVRVNARTGNIVVPSGIY